MTQKPVADGLGEERPQKNKKITRAAPTFWQSLLQSTCSL